MTTASAKELRKALEWIERHYADPDLKHVDFRVEAYRRALEALASQSPPPTDDVRALLGGFVDIEDFCQVLEAMAEAARGAGHGARAEEEERAAKIIRALSAQLPPPIRGEDLTWLRSRLEEALADERDCISIHLTACDAQRLLEALATPSSPEGWVLVPREPTQAMKEAGYRAMMHTDFTGPQETNCYKAMLAASPSSTLGEG